MKETSVEISKKFRLRTEVFWTTEEKRREDEFINKQQK
jgi:hypothetical protein